MAIDAETLEAASAADKPLGVRINDLAIRIRELESAYGAASAKRKPHTGTVLASLRAEIDHREDELARLAQTYVPQR